jgi:hypothetical protein
MDGRQDTTTPSDIRIAVENERRPKLRIQIVGSNRAVLTLDRRDAQIVALHHKFEACDLPALCHGKTQEQVP